MSNRQKILIVDDVPDNIRILTSILEDRYDLYFATSGQECLEAAQENPPDLILLDAIMPEMDGYETCRQLKSEPATEEIPVIFVTALGETDDEIRALEAGAIDYITKPIHPILVQARVHNHLELKRHRDRLRELSLRDGLTGLANRRQFDQSLEAEWRRAIRRGSHCAIIMVDVDYFKKYNDRYGHLAGDNALRNIADCLLRVIRRPGDLAARYGGEELICLLPDTDAEGASILAEAIRTHATELAIRHESSDIAAIITLSCGVASLLAWPGRHANDLIKAADEALYQAKEKGRNQVVVAEAS